MDNPFAILLLLTGCGVLIGLAVATFAAIRLLQAKSREKDGANVILSVLFGGFIYLCSPVSKFFYAVILCFGIAQKNAISLNAMVTTGTLFALVAAVQGLIAARLAKSSETDSLAMISAKLLARLFALLMIELVAIITLVCAFFFA